MVTILNFPVALKTSLGTIFLPWQKCANMEPSIINIVGNLTLSIL